jgi:PAS domain S-box-containing protein
MAPATRRMRFTRNATFMHFPELRHFIEDAPIGAAMFDRDMRYVAFSPRWLTDHRIDDIALGQSHYEVFPELPPRWKDVHRRALAGEVVRETDDHFERAEGVRIWLKWEVRPWRDAEGAVGGIIIFTEDIQRPEARRSSPEGSAGPPASRAVGGAYRHLGLGDRNGSRLSQRRMVRSVRRAARAVAGV